MFTFLLTALLGIFAMTGPNPSANYGNAGIYKPHNEQGGRSSWNCQPGKNEVHLGGSYPGVSSGIWTERHGLSEEPGQYNVWVSITGQGHTVVPGQPFQAAYQRISYHVGGSTYGTEDITIGVPPSEDGVSVQMSWLLDAGVINDPTFGVEFESSIGNDGEGAVRVTRVNITPTRVN